MTANTVLLPFASVIQLKLAVKEGKTLQVENRHAAEQQLKMDSAIGSMPPESGRTPNHT
jgi:hypothetical protein